MEKTPQLMFALQSPVGLRFGATQMVEAERITFEMDVELTKGDTCWFRMELTGLEETVMGLVRIDRIHPKRHGTLPRFVAHILEMPEEDREVFDGWRRDQATGGISRRLERDPEAIQQRITDQMRGSTDAEARVVLDRMSKKSIYKRQTKDLVDGDPFGLGDEHSQKSGQDRDALRSALKASAEQMQEAPPMQMQAQAAPATSAPQPSAPIPAASGADNPSEPDWMRPMHQKDAQDKAQSMDWLTGESSESPTPSEDPTPAPADLDEPAPPPPAPEPIQAAAAVPAEPPAPAPEPVQPEPGTSDLPDEEPPTPPEASGGFNLKPVVVVNPTTQPTEVSVVFLSPSSFASEYALGLSASSLTIQDSAITELYIPVMVKLTLHTGHEVHCNGRTVAQTDEGIAIALELDFDQRKILNEAAGG